MIIVYSPGEVSCHPALEGILMSIRPMVIDDHENYSENRKMIAGSRFKGLPSLIPVRMFSPVSRSTLTQM